MGYQLGGDIEIYGGPTAFGHMGYGGSIGFADPERRLAVGVTKNLFNCEDNTRRIVDTLRSALNDARE